MDPKYYQEKYDNLASKETSWQRCAYKDSTAQESKFKAALGLIDFSRVRSHLDAGCGDGEFIYQVQMLHHGLVSNGVDISLNMLSRAAERCRSISTAHFSQDELNSLWFPSNRFNLITCIGVIQCLEDEIPMLLEFHRLARKGCQLLIIGLDSRSVDPSKKPPGYDLFDKNPEDIEKQIEHLDFTVMKSGGILQSGEVTNDITRDFFIYAIKS